MKIHNMYVCVVTNETFDFLQFVSDFMDDVLITAVLNIHILPLVVNNKKLFKPRYLYLK